MSVNSTLIEQTQATRTNTENLNSKVKENNMDFAKKESDDVQKQESVIEDKKKLIIDAIEKASGKMEVLSKGLEFSIHKQTNQIMIKVIDNNTKEVIKELPSEKILDIMAKMVELSGSFIDEKR